MRASTGTSYARCPGEVLQRNRGDGWQRWSSLSESAALVVAAVELDAERAVFALADGDVYVQYGIRFRREAVGLGIRDLALLGDHVYGVTRNTIVRRAVPPPTATFCDVRIERVLSAEQYRGAGPPSPASQAIRSDPEWVAEEHGMSHVQCRYRVRLRGRSYSYLHVVDTTVRDVPSAPALCDRLRAEVVEHVRGFTDRCVDLSAGEYYGYRLQPLPR